MTTTLAAIYFAAFLANVAATDLTSSLLTYGPLGLFCAYMIWRDEKRTKEVADRDKLFGEKFDSVIDEIRKVSHRLTGLSKGLMLDVATRPGVEQHIKRMAEDLLAKNGNGTDHE